MKKIWHAEKVAFSQLTEHLNDLELSGHTIFSTLNTSGYRGAPAVLIVSYVLQSTTVKGRS